MVNEPPVAERIAFGRSVDSAPTWMLIGRVLVAAIFVISGVAKLTDPSGTAGYMTAQGIPAAHTLAIFAGLAEVAGGLAILFGFLTRIGAFGLILFMVPTTLIFHGFWTMEGAEAKTQMVNFVKNLSIIGGLALLVATGAGRYSIDARIRARR